MDNAKTLKESLYSTIHHHSKLSVEALAEELNISPSYLARAALPDTDMDEVNGTGVRFPLKQLIPLIRATNDYQVLNYIENSLNRVAIPIPDPSPQMRSILLDALMAAAGFGRLMAEISSSCDKDTLSQKDMARIWKEGWAAVSTIMVIIMSCENK